MSKVNNKNTRMSSDRNTRKRYEICSKFTIKTPFFSVSIVDFEEGNVSWDVGFGTVSVVWEQLFFYWFQSRNLLEDEQILKRERYQIGEYQTLVPSMWLRYCWLSKFHSLWKHVCNLKIASYKNWSIKLLCVTN